MIAALYIKNPSIPRRLATALCVAMLAACGGAKQTPPPTPPKPLPRQATPIMSSERLAAESGDFAALARQYEKAAKTLSGNLQTAALLRAGEMQLLSGDESKARETLAGLRGNRFQPVLQAQLLLHENLLEAAERELAKLPSPPPSSLQPVTTAAQARLLVKRGKVTEANDVMSAARYTDGPLGGAVERIVSQFQRWDLLHQRRLLPQWLNVGNTEHRGWLQLADIAQRGWQQPDQYAQNIRQWQQRYSSHPAQQRIAPALLEQSRRINAPKKIALLLGNTDSSQAIATGALATQFGQDSELRVFTATADTLNNQLQQILQWGADALIGPDSAELAPRLQRFSSRRQAPLVLTLAGDAGNKLTTFGLDAASEARSMAEYAVTRNQQRAVLLAPAGPRGDTLSTALEIRLAQLGGDLLAAERYAPGQSDFRALLTRLLEIDSSNTREEELARLLGTELASPNRGRTDVDFLALDVSPLQAKLIQQQLRELRVNNLPIVATNELSGGADFELDGIHFTTTPWQLDNSKNNDAKALAAAFPQRFREHASHLALGHDAYRLLPFLLAKRTANNSSAADRIWQSGLQQAWFVGGTGTLTLNDGAIQRKLPLATFRGRRLVPAE